MSDNTSNEDVLQHLDFETVRRVCEGRGSMQEGRNVADYVRRLQSELWVIASAIWENISRDEAKHWAQGIRVSINRGLDGVPQFSVPEQRSPETACHPEDKCERCGGRNVTWFAPSAVWNAIHGEWDILCPLCFVELAGAAGLKPTSWEIRPEQLSQEPEDPTDTSDMATARHHLKRVLRCFRDEPDDDGDHVARFMEGFVACKVAEMLRADRAYREAQRQEKASNPGGGSDT